MQTQLNALIDQQLAIMKQLQAQSRRKRDRGEYQATCDFMYAAGCLDALMEVAAIIGRKEVAAEIRNLPQQLAAAGSLKH